MMCYTNAAYGAITNKVIFKILPWEYKYRRYRIADCRNRSEHGYQWAPLSRCHRTYQFLTFGSNNVPWFLNSTNSGLVNIPNLFWSYFISIHHICQFRKEQLNIFSVEARCSCQTRRFRVAYWQFRIPLHKTCEPICPSAWIFPSHFRDLYFKSHCTFIWVKNLFYILLHI